MVATEQVCVHPEHFPTLSAARRAVRHGRVLLNGLRSTCAALCAPGDRISLLRAAAADSAAAADPAALLELLYEDAWCGVVVKPQGLPVHGWGSKSLVGRLSTQLQWQQQQQEQLGTGQQQQQPQPLQQRSTSSAAQQHDAPLEKPAFPHRLDTRTGGVLAFATTAAAAAALNEAFRARRVSKRYAAIVVGVPDCTEVLLPLDGKSCSTTVEVMATIASVKYGRLSLVHLWPRTGRKHQLRRHMSLTGTPIIGDAKYELEGGVKLAGPDLMLFAAELRFDHPVVEGVQVCVEADRPENMMQFWEQQQRYWAQRNS
ncbi:pseudouridine synthase [Tribonema minus]|uniref:Pseudouridine synthase n=1 Tax=Tribonema minus TaxID=303371 RepID=A0A836CKI4_9STRA|nr:pseudouridine synthase [Tribonema minus]